MDFLIWRDGLYEPCKTDVLDNECVRFQCDEFLEEFGQVADFALEHENVHGEECADATNSCVADHLGYVFERKVFCASAGVPVGDAVVDRIGPVLDGGF